jgi:hypothetical protein
VCWRPPSISTPSRSIRQRWISPRAARSISSIGSASACRHCPGATDESLATDLEALLAGERRTVELALPDEGSSLLATATIGFTGMQVVVAMPIGPLDWLRSEVLTPIILPALMLVIGVVAIFAGTHLVVNRHVERLAEAVRRHRPGSPGIARATANAPNELEELGARFARLAQDLEEREESLRKAVVQKDLLLREVNHRVKNNLQVVASLLRMRARSGRTAESGRRSVTRMPGSRRSPSCIGGSTRRGRSSRSNWRRSWASCSTT